MIQRIIKACIFDVDGTIAETEGIHLQAFNEAFKEFKVAWNWSKPTYKALLEIAGSENRIRYFNSKTKSNFSNDLIRELVKQKTKIYQEKLLSKSFYVRPGVLELVDALKKSKIKIGVATSTSRDNAMKLFSLIWGNEAQNLFSVISTPKLNVNNKPAPDLYNIALQDLKVRPENVVAIEDSKIGLKSAKAASISTILAPSEFTRGDNFSDADLIVENLLDPRVKKFLGLI